jgi:hypothetical protein
VIKSFIQPAPDVVICKYSILFSIGNIIFENNYSILFRNFKLYSSLLQLKYECTVGGHSYINAGPYCDEFKSLILFMVSATFLDFTNSSTIVTYSKTNMDISWAFHLTWHIHFIKEGFHDYCKKR